MRSALFLAWLSVGACGAVPNPSTEGMLANLVVTFEPNQGQWPRGIEFGAHIGGHVYTISEKEIVIDGSIHLDLASPNGGRFEAIEPAEAKTNYLFSRDRRKWLTGVPNYRKLRRRNAFPGVDLLLYGSGAQLEFDYVVAPGASPDRIHFRVRGAKVEPASGELKLATRFGEVLHLKAPIAYQQTRTGRKTIECRYRVSNSDQVAFTTASFDRSTPLVIDPVLTYLGVLPETYTSPLIYTVTDDTGAFYLAAWSGAYAVAATPGTLRITSPCARVSITCQDSWVMKLNSTDHQVAWATYFPSIDAVDVWAIALDPAGNIVLGGAADSDFPVTPDAYLSTPPPGSAGFLAKLNSTGSAVIYSTFLENVPRLLKVDSRGSIYWSDRTTVRKFTPDGMAMIYSTQTPGGVTQITTDAFGNLYALSGPSPQLTVTPSAYKSSDNDGLYILKFDAQGEQILAASFNASAGNSARPPDIAVDPRGNIIFTGAAGIGVPILNDPAPQTNDCIPQKPCMAYVAALDPTGSNLLYSRLLGHGVGGGLALGPNGDLYVAGDATDLYFPRTWDAFQYCSNPAPSLGSDLTNAVVTENGFVMQLDSQGHRAFSSFLGTSSTYITHLRFAGDGTLYVGGVTSPPNTRGSGNVFFSAVIDTNQPLRIPHACLVNATQNVPDSDLFSLWVAPGQMVTLFGEGIGPQFPAFAQWNADGSLSNTLAGAQVLFDGISAPMLYAQYNQVNCIVPFGIASHPTTSIVVQYAGNQTGPLVFHVTPSVPDPFTTGYFPGADVIAINEDGTLNSADHPAAAGSVITFFVTGLGLTNPPLEDGKIATGPAPATKGISVGFLGPPPNNSTVSGQILYQGAAPGEVAGVYQVNVRIPANITTGHRQVGFAQFDPDGRVISGTGSIWLQ